MSDWDLYDQLPSDLNRQEDEENEDQANDQQQNNEGKMCF